jgi:hypothetical protein
MWEEHTSPLCTMVAITSFSVSLAASTSVPSSCWHRGWQEEAGLDSEDWRRVLTRCLAAGSWPDHLIRHLKPFWCWQLLSHAPVISMPRVTAGPPHSSTYFSGCPVDKPQAVGTGELSVFSGYNKYLSPSVMLNMDTEKWQSRWLSVPAHRPWSLWSVSSNIEHWWEIRWSDSEEVQKANLSLSSL